MRINILLPFFIERPGGGVKVMYQYANLLAERGHDVVVYHAKKTRGLNRKSLRSWCLYLLQRFLSKRVTKRPMWFSLSELIQSVQIAWVSNHLIRDADIVFSTWWATATEMTALSPSKGTKYNLIQDDGSHHPEHKMEIQQSYHLPIQYLAISSHIQKLVFQHTQKTIPIIPNGLDHREFFVRAPIEARLGSRVIMLYSEEIGKGTQYGLEALIQVAKRYPHLQVTLFGVYSNPPKNLPDGFTYHCNPTNLLELYNQSAIFVSPSLQEGWGLPPMEAMACGCACICTRIQGHTEFMDEQTAILVNPRDVQGLIAGVCRLMEDSSYRMHLAYQGIQRVAQFSCEQSVNRLENLFINHK